MSWKASIPVPKQLYFVDGGKLQRVTTSRFRADEIAADWTRMFHYTVKIYVYERNNENESCWYEKV